MKPIDFFRAYVRERMNAGSLLCSEPVVAWAVARGRVPIEIEEQARLWRECGAERGAEIVAERMGLEPLEADDVRDGDAVLLQCIDAAMVLGVCAGKFSVCASGGKAHIGKFQILRGWSLQ